MRGHEKSNVGDIIGWRAGDRLGGRKSKKHYSQARLIPCNIGQLEPLCLKRSTAATQTQATDLEREFL